MAGLRDRPRSSDRGPARSGPSGSVSGATVTTSAYPEAGRPPAPFSDSRPRGQDRSTGDGSGAERDLRGTIPRVLVRISTPAQPARCAGRALVVGITRTKVNYILDADIRSFFEEVSQEWLVRFLEHRIGDRRIIRLMEKWLRAGVLEQGVVTVSDKGTGQGSVVSLLANVYLHYAFDLWAARWRRREATGDMIIVRYADDIVVGFETEAEARRFWDAMRARLREFSLSLHPEKTRLIEFGRFAAVTRRQRGIGKPETFNFLGFTFICGKSRQGQFQLNGRPGQTACALRSRKLRKSCDGGCISRSPNRGAG